MDRVVAKIYWLGDSSLGDRPTGWSSPPAWWWLRHALELGSYQRPSNGNKPELIEHGRSIIRLIANRQAPLVSVSRLFHRIFGVSPGLLSSESGLKVGMQADLEQRDERPAQFLGRVDRERGERLRQLAKAAECPAKSLILRRIERLVSPLTVGGEAHRHAEGVVCRHYRVTDKL